MVSEAFASGIQEMENRINRIDNFLKDDIRQSKDDAEIQEIRGQRPIAVTVHGHQARQLNITDLEEIFQRDHANVPRVTVPNKDILQHQRKARLPLHVTFNNVIHLMNSFLEKKTKNTLSEEKHY